MHPLSALDPSSAPTTDPKLIVHLYHMIAAMDGVYEFLTEYHEDWRAGLRAWLLRYSICVSLLCIFVCSCAVAGLTTTTNALFELVIFSNSVDLPCCVVVV